MELPTLAAGRLHYGEQLLGGWFATVESPSRLAWVPNQLHRFNMVVVGGRVDDEHAAANLVGAVAVCLSNERLLVWRLHRRSRTIRQFLCSIPLDQISALNPQVAKLPDRLCATLSDGSRLALIVDGGAGALRAWIVQLAELDRPT